MCNCCEKYKEYPLLCEKYPMILVCRYCKEHFIWKEENSRVVVDDLLFCSAQCEEDWHREDDKKKYGNK